MTTTQNKDVLAKATAANNEPSLADAPKSKKIGFFSAIMIAIGSCIGAGIFFKADSVLKNSGFSLVLAIFAWVIAAVAVIAMALALIEVTSARNDNLSIIGWVKTFNSRVMYKACKNFMFYIYLPLTYFFMPMYAIQSIQDGVQVVDPNGGRVDWWALMLISILISAYFIFSCGFSSKWGNIQNWIITSVKFIPLLLVIVFGIWSASVNGIANGPEFKQPANGNIQAALQDGSLSFGALTPGFGLFIGIGAIFFAYDGFYVTAGLQTEMKEPKKTPMAIVIGLGLVTLIYLLIAISMSIGGSLTTLGAFLTSQNENLKYLFLVFEIFIGIGVLGIINGFALWAPRFTEDLIREGELPLSVKSSKALVSEKWGKRPWIGMLYSSIISFPIIIIFSIIGAFYVDSSGYGDVYGDRSNRLLSFADLMGTWTAVFAFFFILMAIYGCLMNRKTNKIKTTKSKIFVPFAIISLIVSGLAIGFTFLEPFINLFLLAVVDVNLPGATDAIIGRVLLVIVFFINVALMIVPIFIDNAILKKRYGSSELGAIIYLKQLNAILNKEQFNFEKAKQEAELELKQNKKESNNNCCEQNQCCCCCVADCCESECYDNKCCNDKCSCCDCNCDCIDNCSCCDAHQVAQQSCCSSNCCDSTKK